MTTEDIIGILAGVLTCTSLLPQVVKTIKEKDVKNLSLVMLLVLLAGNSLWTTYGFIKKDWPIITTNTFSILVDITLIVLYFIYKKKE